MEIDEGPFFQRALELIEEYGDDVVDFVNAKVRAVMDARDFEGVIEWTTIRNALANILDGNGTATRQ
ncbi:hypothetical protein [Novosphingobium sp. PY1]|uniref:hypothetical protein n=1 Tax=Novosphingobium sp. PY1 TaxID=1882221 RepID=UPI001A8D5F32|nr:hypothetical protein [Novosphingobium sp. PY1]GFM27152.1 uncharacterized protein PY1_contig-01-13 [Novosphingobium sp. PY1]